MIHTALEKILAGEFRWRAGEPLILAGTEPGDVRYSIKDPSVVYHNGRWHVFCSVRAQKRTHCIEYISFADWKDAGSAPRHLLRGISDRAFCAPQVFYFMPHRKWYMFYHIPDPAIEAGTIPSDRGQCAFYSFTDDIQAPTSWSKPHPCYARDPRDKKALDYWVICDEFKAHLFYTTLEGRIWRRETAIDNFPDKGWGEASLAVEGDVFEASHVYRLKGTGKYLAIIEAQTKERGHWRYFKAYIADRLEGPWKGVADTLQKPFAGMANITFTGQKWSDSVSHGELLRASVDEKLEVDPGNLKALIQGVIRPADTRKYGQIAWKLGLIEAE